MDIAVGHFLSGFTAVFGDFASVSATLATLFPTAQLVDEQLKPLGETVRRTSEDQVAFTGVLTSGAVVSFHFRAGLSAGTPGRVPFVWIVDGEKGTVKVEGPSSFYHVVHPETVLVNGERWTTEEELVDYTGNVAAAWQEIAKGSGEGKYATFEDAVRVHKVVDAIRRSAKEGVRVDLV